MVIYLNIPLVFTPGKIWGACNGATRRILSLLNKGIETKEQTSKIEAQLGFIEKGRTSYILILPNNPEDKRILGIFLNKEYGYTVLKGEELFVASSSGGYGNSESKMGIYTVNTIIKVNSYNNRRGYTYYELTETGWQKLGNDAILPDDQINLI